MTPPAPNAPTVPRAPTVPTVPPAVPVLSSPMTPTAAQHPRLALVVNPAAGHGRAETVARRAIAALDGRADLTVSTPRGGAADSLAALVAAAESGPDAVLVCGGDGLVHLAANVLAGGTIPLGIIPGGSGNDTAATLGIDPDPGAAAAQLLAAVRTGTTRRIDVGRCDGPALIPGTDRAFVGLAYAGLDARVNDLANRLRWPTGPARYNAALAIEALRLKTQRFTLTLDGRAVALPALLIAVGNNARYGGGKRIAPHASWDDGLLGLAVIGPVSRFTLARLAPTLPHAGHAGHRRAWLPTAREVQLAGPPGAVAYADGERIGPLPLAAWTDPAALPVLVPVR